MHLTDQAEKSLRRKSPGSSLQLILCNSFPCLATSQSLIGEVLVWHQPPQMVGVARCSLSKHQLTVQYIQWKLALLMWQTVSGIALWITRQTCKKWLPAYICCGRKYWCDYNLHPTIIVQDSAVPYVISNDTSIRFQSCEKHAPSLRHQIYHNGQESREAEGVRVRPSVTCCCCWLPVAALCVSVCGWWSCF